MIVMVVELGLSSGCCLSHARQGHRVEDNPAWAALQAQHTDDEAARTRQSFCVSW